MFAGAREFHPADQKIICKSFVLFPSLHCYLSLLCTLSLNYFIFFFTLLPVTLMSNLFHLLCNCGVYCLVSPHQALVESCCLPRYLSLPSLPHQSTHSCIVYYSPMPTQSVCSNHSVLTSEYLQLHLQLLIGVITHMHGLIPLQSRDRHIMLEFLWEF